ncbi:sugar phosphate isomerase/epimerase family protein [Metabacillus dongyingensis]|uniref:sugar phosphate isomerase/epimerase family protein n=1 Tax=Metabacillus dongyingensis TaxID=2874282 RepID=UPI001CC107A7|nr:sugar phosphate isomerase/epimerase [Metabacillus dongyingensis]UAL54366.1 sugar phosphate isomerase/epimerase [Metabacillus dongyingensis]
MSKRIPVALQMYTLRNETEKDFIGTLKKVANIGYDGVEFAGYGGLEASELKKALDDFGLKPASSHIPLETLELDLNSVIEYQHVIGNKYIVCPFLPPERRSEQDYRELVSILNSIGETCHKEGLSFAYHNHDFELQPLSDGIKPLELLLEETNHDWVKAEFDVYWLTKAGEDPVKWLEKYQGRTPLVHLKDMTTEGEQFFAELGTGGVNLEAILNKGESSKVNWWIVEQDQSRRSPLDSIEISFQYLTKNYIKV